jgi:hypothetical protein
VVDRSETERAQIQHTVPMTSHDEGHMLR